MRYRIALLLIALSALVAAGCSGLSSEPRIVATLPADAGNSDEAQLASTMALGGELWQANCAECHGRTGEGAANGVPLPDLTGKSDEELLAVIINGTTANGVTMPAFGETFTDEQIDAAMTFAKMLSLAISRGMVNASATDEPNATDEAPALADAGITRGTVSGVLTNGTAGAAVPPDSTVTLHVIESDIAEEAFEAVVNADGSYRFADVPFSADYQYVITAPYGDVQYVSDIAVLDGGETEMTLPVTVYEGGATADSIVITGMSAQVMVANSVMQVIELANFTNTSDRVYFSVVDGVGTSVALRIPPDATMLSSVSDRYLVEGNTIADTRPLLPGEDHLIHVAYSLPYSGGVSVMQPLDYALTGDFNVIMATSGLTAAGNGIVQLDPITSGGNSYANFGGALDLAAGSTLTFDVSGTPVMPASSAGTTGSSSLTPFAYVLIGAGISSLLISAVLIVRERAKKTKTAAPEQSAIAQLMEQIAALDSQHQAGAIKTKEYQRQRSALKAELSTLMKAQ
jgi:cytochrome c553